ncbi:MAG: transglycosylase domain-containing protein [Prolixibacteraceae bacterium]
MPQKKIQKKQDNATRRKSRTKKKSQRSVPQRILLFFIKFLVLGAIVFAILFTAVYFGFLGYVPSTAQLLEVKNPQASEVFSEDGRLLGRYYVENRSNVNYEEISANVIHALVATEDSRFYEHRGIDEVALFRVLIKTILLQDRSAGGGSTLSQQIAKNLFPRNDLWLFAMPVNKLREAIIAYRLERIYTKEEILTLYLNTVPFGEFIFGIEVAAERFFSKSPKDLTVDEAAVLVGMLKANNRYNPRLHPELSRERRDVVINQMVKHNYLSQAEGEKFKSKPLVVKYRRISYNEGPAPYFLELMKPELLKWCMNNKKENGDSYNLYTDGLRIATTVNYDYQTFAEESVREQMKSLQEVFDNHWKNSAPWDRNPGILKRAMKQTERYKKMAAAGKSEQQIQEAFRKKIETTLFSWNGDQHMQTTPLDSLKHYLRMLNAGFLALEPSTGEIKAWVGGIDFRFFKYDHVNAARQAGSTFKPFIYLAALENGISPYEYFPNEKKVYPDYQNWSPRNSHDHYEGYYSMEGALAQSINTIAVDVLMQTGIEPAIQVAHELGIERDLPVFPSLALGVASVSLREMVVAYSTILNGGARPQPHYLVSVSDSKGQVLAKFQRPPLQRTSIDEENCRILVHMLESVVDSGTGGAIRSRYNITGDFAGKTGTTQDQSDGWFIGMSPDLVTGCWVGGEVPGIHFRSITYGQGAYTALPVVGGFFNRLYREPRYKDMRYAYFPEPPGDVLAELDIPPYREMLERQQIGDIIKGIFGNRETRRGDDEDLKERRVPEEKKEKKKVWDVFKDIFGKKD